jgi:hypothetical protein
MLKDDAKELAMHLSIVNEKMLMLTSSLGAYATERNRLRKDLIIHALKLNGMLQAYKRNIKDLESQKRCDAA